MPEIDGACRQLRSERVGELVVAALDVPLFVGAGEDGVRFRLVSVRRTRVIAQKKNEIKRGLLFGWAAILVDDVGIAQLAERAAQAAGNIGVDPLADRKLIPCICGLGIMFVVRAWSLAHGVAEQFPA